MVLNGLTLEQVAARLKLALPLLVVALAGLVAAGCAGGAGQYGAAMAMPAGQSCRSVRAELNRLDARGTPSKIEAASRGKKLSRTARADVDRYNRLLNIYLGAGCHT